MIIHPELQAATPEQRKRLQELEKQLSAVMETLRETTEGINAATLEGDEKKIIELQEKTTKALRESAALFSEKDALTEQIDENYIKSLNGNKDSILKAAHKLLESVKQADFIERSNREADHHRRKTEDDKPQQQIHKVFPETYTGANRYLTAYLYLLFEASKRAKISREPLYFLIDKKVREWGYEPKDDPALHFPAGEHRAAEPEGDAEQLAKQLRTQEDLEKLRAVSQPAFLTMVHGKGTDSLALMIKRKPETISKTGRAIIKFQGVELTLENYNSKSGPLSVSTDKLFRAALAEFTDNNHVGAKGRVLKNTTVHIPLWEYAAKCGYDVLPHPDETPQEAAKRTKDPKKKARAKIKKDLDILYSGSLEWTERTKGESKSFLKTRILETVGTIKDNYITMTFGNTFAEYLIQQPIMQYSAALLRIDERNPNAYNMGLKITSYYSNDANYKMNRNDRLKVQTLLAVCNLPDIETVKQQRNSWTRYIKTPFENSLNALIECGLLSMWEYKDNGQDYSDYYEWEKALIHFELATPIDPADRLQRKEQIIEARTKAKHEREAKQADKKEDAADATE